MQSAGMDTLDPSRPGYDLRSSDMGYWLVPSRGSTLPTAQTTGVTVLPYMGMALTLRSVSYNICIW